MRSTLTAMVVAAGLLGFGAAAQAAPATALPGVAAESPLVQAQMHGERRMHGRRMERRMMNHRRMERRMMNQRSMRHGRPARHNM